MISVEIPMTPPSINHYYIHVGKRKVIGEKGLEFRALVAYLVPRDKVIYPGERLVFTARIHWADRRKRDLDNAMKCLIDAFAIAVGFDDCQIDELHVYRVPFVKGQRAFVNVKIEVM